MTARHIGIAIVVAALSACNSTSGNQVPTPEQMAMQNGLNLLQTGEPLAALRRPDQQHPSPVGLRES